MAHSVSRGSFVGKWVDWNSWCKVLTELYRIISDGRMLMDSTRDSKGKNFRGKLLPIDSDNSLIKRFLKL